MLTKKQNIIKIRLGVLSSSSSFIYLYFKKKNYISQI